MQQLNNESMRPKKVKVCITLDEEVVNKMRYLSDNALRSFSQYINIVLINYIKKIENK